MFLSEAEGMADDTACVDEGDRAHYDVVRDLGQHRTWNEVPASTRDGIPPSGEVRFGRR